MKPVTAQQFIAAMLCPRSTDPQASRRDFHYLLEAWKLMAQRDRDIYAKQSRGMNYNKFTDTRYWAILRDEAMHRYGRYCRTCKCQRPPFELHHLTYDHRGIEFLHMEDLTILCWLCHGARHGGLTTEQTHAWTRRVMKYATPEQAKALNSYAHDRPFPELIDRVAMAKRMK